MAATDATDGANALDGVARAGSTCGEPVQRVSSEGLRRQGRCGAGATRAFRYETPWHSWSLVHRCEPHAARFEQQMRRQRTRYERLTDPAPR